MYDVGAVRRDFPILGREVHGRPLVYLDNGASAQKPQAVIDAVSRAYSMEYANVHRGLHYLSSIATEKYETVLNVTPQLKASTFDLDDGFSTEIENFVATCLGEAESVAPVWHGAEIMKILDAIYESAALGREVTFD